MKIGGEDLLAQIEQESPKTGIYFRRYILPSIQARGLAGHVLATPTDKPGPVELTPLTSVITAGENVAVTPAPTASTGGSSNSGAVIISSKVGVTSVGLTGPARQTVTPSTPITDSGTFVISDNPQPANYVFAGPAAGNPDVPTFRPLVAADIPSTGGGGGGGGGALTGTNLVLSENVTPAGGVAITQLEADLIVQGGGINLGNLGGWNVAVNCAVHGKFAQRGITQSYGARQDKHAVGDCAGAYLYNYTDGGVAAASDEGATAITAQMNENPGWFHGTVASTVGTGDTAPVLSFTSGNAWTTDGGYLLNISKGTLSGTLTGTSTNLSLTINSGSVATFLNYLTVSGASLPVSTAIGIATAAISPAKTTRNIPVPVTVTVNLAQIGGVYKLFTNGSVVDVAGINYPEQSVVSNASGLLAGNQQTFTLNVCNPNSQAIIFQGGIQGQYISADANVMRSAYFAFGSLTGSDMIYANQVAGNVSNNTLPNLGCENWTATGANSAWHLYPGAEVVANTDQGFACRIEQNGVAWTAGDTVECARFPTSGGATAFFVRNQYMPSNNSFSMSGLSVLMNGPGTAGGNITGMSLRNNYPAANYSGSGGPLSAPIGLKIVGTWAPTIYVAQAPDAGSLILVQSNNNAGTDTTDVINLNYGGSGHLTYTVSTQRWHVDRMDSAVFSASGTNGITTTTGGLTFNGGILTSGSIVGGSGTVTSVAVTVPGDKSVSGSPVTTSGTIAITDNNQSANTFKAGPSTGSPATPGYRAIVAADLPLGSSSAFGAVKVDGTTITASAGVISAVGGSAFPLTFIQNTPFQASTTFTFPHALQASAATAFLLFAIDTSAAFTTPSGWTLGFKQDSVASSPGGTNDRLVLIYKTSAGDTSVTLGGSAPVCGRFFEVSGSHALDQVSSSFTTNTSFLALPSITPTAGSVVFGAMASAVNGVNSAAFQAAPMYPGYVALDYYTGTNNSRVLGGFMGNQSATHVSTTPPPINIPFITLFSGTGIAYASFSIL